MTRVYLKPGVFSRWRQFARLKQEAVAQDCGWTQSEQSHVERGARSVARTKLDIMVGAITKALEDDGLPAPNAEDMIARVRAA